MSQTNEFGQFFRQRRSSLELSLSAFCRQNGYDKGNISRLERGIKRPPESEELLKSYAEALKLEPKSEDWKTFMGHAAIARGKLPSPVSEERAGDVEAMFRRLGRRLHDSWVKAHDFERWSSSRAAQSELPNLLRRLIHASTEKPARIEVPGGDGVQRHGWDGIVETETKALFVPQGVSGWEISVEQPPANKAERVFKERNKGPLGLSPADSTFVFVTSRKWDRKQEWRDQKRKLRKWKGVEVYDSADLEAWLEAAPGVDAWIAELIGRRPPGVIAISDYWEVLSCLSEPLFRPRVFLASRRKAVEELRKFLLGTSSVLPIRSRSPVEAIDFVSAYLALTKDDDADLAMDEGDRLRIQSRTLVVRDRAQWDGLSQASGSLNLLPAPFLSLTPEDQNIAVRRGHRVLIAASQFANHRVQGIVDLPRPYRRELEMALVDSGVKPKIASAAARAAGGSLSVLKRALSTIPYPQVPGWCSDASVKDFIPMLLVGAWDDSNEADRSVLSRLSGHPYGELQNAANRLMLVDDAPIMRTESRWRLVSPEDAWSLVGSRVTDDALDSFAETAIEVLSQDDEPLKLSADDRFRSSLRKNAQPRATELLRRGISETTAIIGTEFGPLADLSTMRGPDRAASIMRATLHKATWLRWTSLRHELPLLAEAAPEKFLAAVNVDLKRKRPELAKALADDESDDPLMSVCKHAGLLWALKGLAWSSELLPKVCVTLARLAEIDPGGWANRPAGSLRDILLTWNPQTAAGVDHRIAVLRALADRTPDVAWKLLRAMLPQAHSLAVPTRRPVWRDWALEWREGTTGVDYWKQVDASAELIVQQVGTESSRWIDVLDDLQSFPEPSRNLLLSRLQNLPVENLSTEERRRLTEHLRKTICMHRDFGDARWALPAECVDQLESALASLMADESPERHAWLFVPGLELEGFRGKYRRMEAEAARLRQNALSEILTQDGFDGVLQLAETVEAPGQIGSELARGQLVADETILPVMLSDRDPKRRMLATCFAGARIVRGGWEWVRQLPLSDWKPTETATFLSQAAFNAVTWRFTEDQDENVFEEYWRTVPVYGCSHLDQEQLEYACSMLLKVDRVDSAIDALACVTFARVTVSPFLVMDALEACLNWKQTNPESVIGDETLHTIQLLFGWVQNAVPHNDEEPFRRLAQLEWQFLSLLDGFGAVPRTLIRCLSDDPKFFTDLIATIFRSNHEIDQNAESTEEKQSQASHAYRLLMNWNEIPGQRLDRSIDEQQLMEWLDSARSLCRESGHLEVADEQIGEMLASWPKPKDGDDTMWPCEEICDAIEETDSDDLDRGFQIGIFNGRGVVARSPLEGGAPEYREADKYRRWAVACDVDWPRTAASLRHVAAFYERDAKREDERAEERAQERY